MIEYLKNTLDTLNYVQCIGIGIFIGLMLMFVISIGIIVGRLLSGEKIQ